MSIDSPVKEGDEGVFKRYPLLGLRVDVEGKVIVTLDVHEPVVQVKHRSQKRLLLKVSPE